MGLIYNTQKIVEQFETGQVRDRMSRIEYHFLSWRELFNKSLLTADRYSTEGGRWILAGPSYPFYQLFLVSYPYYKLPQELCLQFGCFEETVEAQLPNGTKYSSTGPPFERVAHEFAAFLSLFSRRPAIPIGLRRWDDIPRNQSPFYLTLEKYEVEEPPPPAGIDPNEFIAFLKGMVYLDTGTAQAIMNAVKSHHMAISMLYFDSSSAYVMLVSAIESLAGNEYKQLKLDFESIEKFEKLYELFEKLSNVPGTESIIAQIKEELVRREPFLCKKFVMFITDNIPDSFWEIPDELQKPSLPSEVLRDDFERYLKKIYDFRSKNLHQGIPFPSYVDFGARRYIAPDSMLELAQAKLKDIFVPPFNWFERVVHYVTIEYLKKKCAPHLIEQEKGRVEEKRQLFQRIDNFDEALRGALYKLVLSTARFIGTNVIGPHVPNREWADKRETIEVLKKLDFIDSDKLDLDGSSWIKNQEVGEVLGDYFLGVDNNLFRADRILVPKGFELHTESKSNDGG